MDEGGNHAAVIEARGLRKTYRAVEALKSADIVVRHQEVVGVAGDNGAGKSTLMKIVSGAIPPTSGELLCEGEPITEYSPAAARRHGIDTVYQDLSLCDNLTVAENVFLGRELRRRALLGIPIIDEKEMAVRTESLLGRLGIEIESVFAPLSTLSGGQRQAVAISRALAFDPKIVVLDEPTAALSVTASRPLLEMIKRLPEQGASVMLVSHRLTDLLESTSRIYVLRHGAVVAELTTEETDEEELLRLMAGLARLDGRSNPSQASGTRVEGRPTINERRGEGS